MQTVETQNGEMKVLVMLGRKGGTGKSTIGVNLAVAAEKAGHSTLLVDLDPQASAAKWKDHREAETPVVVATPISRLKEILSKAKEAGATLVILDTAQNSDSEDAAEIADMVLIPAHTSSSDLYALTSTINMVRRANVPARIVFNDVPPRGESRVEDAREAAKMFDVPCVPFHVVDRVAFVDSYNAGLSVEEYEPRGKASREIRDLYKYISDEMGV